MDSFRRGSVRSTSSTNTSHSSSSSRSSYSRSSTASDATSSRTGKREDSTGSRLLSSVKTWVSTSEPSTQALRQHKFDTYKKAGISMTDPRANAKLHIPLGGIPEEAIKPYGRGPEPEEVVLRKAAERREARSPSSAGLSTRSSGSYSVRAEASSIRRGSGGGGAGAGASREVAPFDFDRPDPFARRR